MSPTSGGKHEVRRYRQAETSGIVVARRNGQGADLRQLIAFADVCVDRSQYEL